MNPSEILQSKGFIIAAVLIGFGVLVYFSGLYSVLKRIMYDILWNKTTGAFDYNNMAKTTVLFTTIFLVLATHIKIRFNPFLIEPEKPTTELFALLLLYSLGESAFKMFFNRAPSTPDNKIEVKSEVTNIRPATTAAPVVKPLPLVAAEAPDLSDVPLDSKVLKAEIKPDLG